MCSKIFLLADAGFEALSKKRRGKWSRGVALKVGYITTLTIHCKILEDSELARVAHRLIKRPAMIFVKYSNIKRIARFSSSQFVSFKGRA